MELIRRERAINYIYRHKDLPATYRQWTVKEASSVTHNTKLLVLSPPPTACQFSVPVGHHVNIRTLVEDTEILRPYTPVTDLNSLSVETDSSLRFLIKIYPDGALTPGLGRLCPGDLVTISDHLGSFSMTQIPDTGSVTLLAAGTGITPMVAILTSLQARKQRPTLRLVTFDRSTEDIIWKDQVGCVLTISKCDIKRFFVSSRYLNTRTQTGCR